MTERRFVVCPAADYQTENNHYADCEARRIPHIVVNPARKYATVSWDFITLPIDQESCLTDNADSIAPQIEELQRRYGGKIRSNSTVSVGWIERLDPTNAEIVAGEIYDILTRHLPACV